MRALLIANGRIKCLKFYRDIVKEQYDLIICADGGVKNAMSLGIKPDIIIGDFDSIEESLLDNLNSNVKIIKYPPEKDKTDTELVLDYLIENRYKDVTMIGCIGDRVDHTLANIFLLKNLLINSIDASIIDHKNCITLVDSQVEITGKRGSILSLMPISQEVLGVTTEGLYYELKDSTMYRHSSYGISNSIVSNHANISVKKGDLLLIIAKD